MASLTAASTHLGFSRSPFPLLNSPCFIPISLVVAPAKRGFHKGSTQKEVKQRRDSVLLLGISDSWSVLRRCRRFESEDPEGYGELEEEVRKFMETSKKPNLFPTRKELIEGGRADLAEAIVKKGGWMTIGWDLDDRKEKFEKIDWRAELAKFGLIGAGVNTITGSEKNVGEESETKKGEEGSGSKGNEGEDGSGLLSNEVVIPEDEGSSLSGDNLPVSSSSGTSGVASQDTGVEGILNRLEKERNLSFGINMGKNDNTHLFSHYVEDLQYAGTLITVDSCCPEQSDWSSSLSSDNKHIGANGSFPKFDGLKNSVKPETWRTWSIRRAGFADREFEAGEIDFEESRKRRAVDASTGEMIAKAKVVEEPFDKELNVCGKEISPDQIKARLHHLEQELSMALLLLRSNSDDSTQKANSDDLTQKGSNSHDSTKKRSNSDASTKKRSNSDDSKQKDHELSDDLRRLYDAWEFQENEIMHVQGKLRSTRAKLAVVEGKMALATIDSRRAMGEKQKKIDDAHKALQLLRTTCIVWPNAGSEVFLAGSFDGWSSQRKMLKSSTGIFSVSLQLYPGTYKIKFIVDGMWKIDPLRPVLHNDGYENNLLIVP
ncbi:hypothetical protein Ancab_020648 [Ancistrocladus abbreviatus]